MAEVHEVHTHSDAPTEAAAAESGAASGMLLGIVVALLVLAVLAFVFFGGAFRPSTTTTTPSGGNNPTNVQVNPPSAPPKIDVNVNTPPQSGGSQSAPAQPKQ